jgi:hypothetical protein
MADGDIKAVLHEMEFAPKERIGVGSGSHGMGGAVSLRFLRLLESGGHKTDGRGLPMKLEEIIERRRHRVRFD